jgi:hypothetical protein
VGALVRGRRFEEAKLRLERLAAGPGGAVDRRRRIYRLAAARSLHEADVDDPELVADADALGDLVLRGDRGEPPLTVACSWARRGRESR